MRRQLRVGIAIAVAAVIGIGGLVYANQQGWFGGRAKQLLALAAGAQSHGRLPEAQAHLEELIATFPDSPWADDGLLKLGQVYEAQQQLVEARAMYRMLLDRFPESPLVGSTQTQLGQVNVALLFSPIVTDLDAVYHVKAGDTLGKIAAAHGTTVEYLQRANRLTSDVIRPTQKLKVPKSRFSIVVDISQHQLLLAADDQFIKTYAVATGRDHSTPAGTFTIVNKVPNPVWYREGAVVPSNSPENVLGSRWMGFNKQGYGIHGTVDPGAIGHQVTEGCIRMMNRDVEELFAIVPIGTEVTIVE